MGNLLNIPDRFVNLRTLSHDKTITHDRVMKLVRYWGCDDDPAVVRAFDTDRNREVVLKIGMFRDREIEILPTLDHQGIPTLGATWDIGSLKHDGLPYTGHSEDFLGDVYWGKLCEKGVQHDRATVLAYKLVQIVKYIHGTGIVHGDLHDGNIRVSGDNVYVIDFADSVRLSPGAELEAIQAREMETVQCHISKLEAK